MSQAGIDIVALVLAFVITFGVVVFFALLWRKEK